MGKNVLVAEPSSANWASIAKGIARTWPEASILRVKDGEQAIRVLFHQGLLTDEPLMPHLVLLTDDLPKVSAERVLERLRQHPRTCATPVIMLRPHDAVANVAVSDVSGNLEPAVTLSGTDALESRIADAVRQLSVPEHLP